MAHDRQVEQDQENSTALNKRSKTSRDVVADWLRLYQAMPYMRDDHAITEEVILFYMDSLADLKNPLALHKAFQWCRDHIKFLPQPVEILDAYGTQMAKLLEQEMEKREQILLCGDCRGTGWKMVKREDGAGEWAVACDCRKVKGAA